MVASQSCRVVDHQAVHIEDVVAVVGDDPGPIHGLATELREFARHQWARHRDHFHRQREAAEAVDQFGFVGDADEAAGPRRR